MDSNVNSNALERLYIKSGGISVNKQFVGSISQQSLSSAINKELQPRSLFTTIATLDDEDEIVCKYHQDNVISILSGLHIPPETLIRIGGKWPINIDTVNMCKVYNLGFINDRNQLVFNEDFMLLVEIAML